MTSKDIERTRRQQMWPDIFGARFFDWDPFAMFHEGERTLRVEEHTEGDELIVRAEMPGVDPDKDVQVHVRNHVLEIRAERTEKTQEKEEKGSKRSEFRYGSFYRAVSLPPDARESDVHATYKDGILEVRMPLDGKQAEATKIEITRE
jgi:HSP20 family protein